MEAGFHLIRTKQKGVNTPPLAEVSRGGSHLSIPRGLPRGGFIFIEIKTPYLFEDTGLTPLNNPSMAELAPGAI